MADESKPFAGFRNPLLYTSVLMLVVLIYLGITFLSRRQQNRELEEQAKAKQRQQDSQSVENLGGDRFEILNFYASPTRRPSRSIRRLRASGRRSTAASTFPRRKTPRTHSPRRTPLEIARPRR